MITRTDIESFREFALAKINNGGASSMEECVRLWQEDVEYQASLAALRESIEECNAGRTIPAAQAMEEIRAELRLPPRRRPSDV